VILAREVAVTVYRGWLLRRGVTMAASVYGKIKTVTQIAAVTLYLLPGVPEALRFGALLVAIVATIASGVEYIGRGRRLLSDQGRITKEPVSG
jgi:CDP-diacylglycerol--glycerol-3-phosphate 3-phosphatidyltransferase